MSIETETRGHILLIGVHRADKMNALSKALWHEVNRALFRLDHDANLRVAVLWAEGPHFTAGVDLADWADTFGNGSAPAIADDEIDLFGMVGPRRRKPLVIAVQGRCYTWGLEALLNSELRVAAEDTRFAMLEVKRGFFACGGATLRLPKEIGWCHAQRFLLTGEEWTAAQALAWGMVNAVVAPGQQLNSALDLAERVARAAPLGVQGSLASTRIAWIEGEHAAQNRIYADLAQVMKSGDVKEGIQSFIERREAQFKGH